MRTFAADFRRDADRHCADRGHRKFISRALDGYYLKRDENQARFRDWDRARQAAAEIKREVINHLDEYLDRFALNLEAGGAAVFWAATAREARDYITEVAQANDVRHVIKSKSMTSEEIHLNEALARAGVEVFESDLGEFIVQLREEPPYHLVFPSMHLTRQEIGDLFHAKLGGARVEEPEQLTMVARRIMRRKFCEADMGISGVNFGVADTGIISITENEGNARLTTALPRIHVALMGIEKLVRSMDDLALFLPMLATAGAGQHLTAYNTLYAGPRRDGEIDGPGQLHVVLLDNGRTAALAHVEQRNVLHCIRCGACLNVCPIFKTVGGHSYGTVYGGPIGSVLTPRLRNMRDWKHLSFASSLCGACSQTCPVKIDLSHHLLRNRRDAVRQHPPFFESLLWKAYAAVMKRPRLYRLAARTAHSLQPLHRMIEGSVLDPMRAWTRTRKTPALAPQSFTAWWRAGRGPRA